MTNSAIGEIYNQQADTYAGYAENRFAWQYLEQPAFDHYVSDFYKSNTHVLDIGCGNGLVARHFVERGVLPQNIMGIDPSSGQLALARQATPGANFVESSAESFDVEPESLDLVVTNTVLHHLDNDQLEAMLARIYVTLKPGGVYFFVDIDPDQSAESFDPKRVNTWKDVATPWGTQVPFFNRQPGALLDALNRHGFDMVAGAPLSIAPEALLEDPVQYEHYDSRPSRMAARFQKIPTMKKIPRYYDVHIPNLIQSPEEEIKATLVDDYFKAWNKQSLQLISQIFSTDAIYDEKPGEREALRGLESIQQYWQENPVAQQNIRTDYHIIGHSPDKAVWARFSAAFIARNKPDVVQGYIKFEIDATTKKIRRLTEWFEHV